MIFECGILSNYFLFSQRMEYMFIPDYFNSDYFNSALIHKQGMV